MRSIWIRASAAALAAALLAPGASADEAAAGSANAFQFRVRVVYLEPDNPVIPVGPHMGGRAYPQVSADWSLAPSWSNEFSIVIPTADFTLPASAGMGMRLMPFVGTLKCHLESP